MTIVYVLWIIFAGGGNSFGHTVYENRSDCIEVANAMTAAWEGRQKAICTALVMVGKDKQP